MYRYMSSACVTMSGSSVTISRFRLSLLLFRCVHMYGCNMCRHKCINMYEQCMCGDESYMIDHISFPSELTTLEMCLFV